MLCKSYLESITDHGGSVAEWFGRPTSPSSSSALSALDLFEVVPGSTPRLRLYIAKL